MEVLGGGARGRNRTADTMIFSHVLYQLSYPGIAAAVACSGQRAIGSAPMAKLDELGKRELFFRCVLWVYGAAGQCVTVVQPAVQVAVPAAC